MVNYKHEAGFDEGGVSRDFFTNFSLAMANGRGVARCDFKLVHRGDSSEPITYVCISKTDLFASSWDVADNRFDVGKTKSGRVLMPGELFQVSEIRTDSADGSVALRTAA
eukprot:SAG31_NODE_20530_length_571_cov_0.708245_1_plen_109_part_01